jgi:hypothetical protein
MNNMHIMKEDAYTRNESDRCLIQNGDDSGSVSHQSNDESCVFDQNLSVNSLESRGHGYQDYRTSSSHENSSPLVDENGRPVILPNYRLRQPSHRPIKTPPDQGQSHPGAYANYIRNQQVDYDRTYLDVSYDPSVDSRESDSILTLNPPPSEGSRGNDSILILKFWKRNLQLR